MAISKIILNGVTQMDVTQDTVAASNLLSGYTATKNDGTKVSGSYVPSGVSLQTKSKTYTPTTSQQTETISPDSGYNGLSSVGVTVNAMPSGTAGTPTATKGIVSNHSVSVTPSVTNTTGYITGSTKTGTAVTVSASELVSGTKSISANGTGIDVTNYATVDVAVPATTPVVESLTVTPNETQQVFSGEETQLYDLGWNSPGSRTISLAVGSSYYIEYAYYKNGGFDLVGSDNFIYTASSEGTSFCHNYFSITNSSVVLNNATYDYYTVKIYELGVDGYKPVTVNAISSSYVGSGITRRSSTDLIISGATVTVPAGYYSAAASKSVTTMTLPSTLQVAATTGYTKILTIDRQTSTRYINIREGYNSTASYYEIAAVPDGSATGPTSLSGSSATITTGTNTITLTKTNVTTTPTVSAGYVSSATASTATVTLTASVTTKAAATITPGTTNQTIAAGTYLTGTQTITGDADLVGSNIISTANIFGVQGTVTIQKYYTGASAPSSSLGSNGDIYLQE